MRPPPSFLLAGLLVAACSRSVPEAASFVGRQACGECHVAEVAAWEDSHHAVAMQPADSGAVLGDFGGARFTYTTGTTTTAFRQDGRYWVRTDGPDGRLTEYPIAYTFGVTPLQEYLIAFPGGRLQALNVLWDTRPAAEGGQRWFHLYPTERVDHGDILHWTGPLQNWNFMCAECHSTDLRKNYRPDSGTYATAWAELSVSCEACHGPGSRHVAERRTERGPSANSGFDLPLRRAPAGTWRFPEGEPIARRAEPLASGAEVETCARCHARRSAEWDEFRYGAPLAQSHRIALLDEGLYHADGQILDEVYEYGSFLQSRMHAAGVTCSDCHEPHRGTLRAEGNALCANCHLPARYDAPSHTFHPPGPGTRCVSCHMTERLYMGVDGRRDHSFRVPRPDLSLRLGTPNACTDCHADRAAAWADEWLGRWFGPRRRAGWHFGDAIAAGRRRARGAEDALWRAAFDPAVPSIARATAVSLLPANPGPRTLDGIELASRDTSALVRRAAAEALQQVDPSDRLRLGLPLLDDSIRTVRLPAASALAAVPPSAWAAEDRARFDLVAEEYRQSQRVNADRPESWLNLGAFEAHLGRPAEAEDGYRAAIRLAPRFAAGYVALAQWMAEQGRESDAERVLREGLAAAPEAADLHHALGLSLVRQGRVSEALGSLGQAAALDPGSARFAYVHGVALFDQGEPVRAKAVLAAAAGRHPADRDILQALVAWAVQTADLPAARQWAERLVEVAPDDPGARQQLDGIRRMRVLERP